jgi:hypothetical protein
MITPWQSASVRGNRLLFLDDIRAFVKHDLIHCQIQNTKPVNFNPINVESIINRLKFNSGIEQETKISPLRRKGRSREESPPGRRSQRRPLYRT